jgi:hypothetical protein
MRTPEHVRLERARTGAVPWKAWGPYLSERQWGTVREDYSRDGDAWNHPTHDQARSRAYRCREDDIAGICDECGDNGAGLGASHQTGWTGAVATVLRIAG